MFYRRKNLFFLGSLLLVAFGFLLLPKFVFASPGVFGLLANIVLGIVSFFGRVLALITRLLVAVAQYNDFINSPAVSIGWIVLRDICNMFFVLALLIIAFCSVLGIERYSYKRALGSLILAIILVNFSKLILGFCIDVAQVVMLTFVNAFASATEGNFAEMFGLRQLLSYRKQFPGEIKEEEILISALLALLLLIVALVVVSIITLLLIFRIVVLWFLIVFSPLPFLLGLFPQTKGLISNFWSRFTNQVIIGPILAFCLWLSLAVVQQAGESKLYTVMGGEVSSRLQSGGEEFGEVGSSSPSGLTATITKIGESSMILGFTIGIVMLIGSLSMAQQLGVAGGAMAGRAIGRMQDYARGAAKWTAKAPFRGLDRGLQATWKKAGIAPVVQAFWEKFTTNTRLGRFIKRRYDKEERERMEKEREIKARARVGLITKPLTEMQIQEERGRLYRGGLEKRGVFESREAFMAYWENLKTNARANTDEGIEMARQGARQGWLSMGEINQYALNGVKTDREKTLSEWIRSQHSDPLTRINKTYKWDQDKKTYKTLSLEEKLENCQKALAGMRPYEIGKVFFGASKKAGLKYDSVTKQNVPIDREFLYSLKALNKDQFEELSKDTKDSILDAFLLVSINREQFGLTLEEAEAFEKKYDEFGGIDMAGRKEKLSKDQGDRLLEEVKAARIAEMKIHLPKSTLAVQKALKEIGSRVDMKGMSEAKNLINEINTALEKNNFNEAKEKYLELVKLYAEKASDEKLTGLRDPTTKKKLTEKQLVNVISSVILTDFNTKLEKEPTLARKILDVGVNQFVSPEKITLDMRGEIYNRLKVDHVSDLTKLSSDLTEGLTKPFEDLNNLDKLITSKPEMSEEKKKQIENQIIDQIRNIGNNVAIAERSFQDILRRMHNQVMSYGCELPEEIKKAVDSVRQQFEKAKQQLKKVEEKPTQVNIENISQAIDDLKNLKNLIDQWNF